MTQYKMSSSNNTINAVHHAGVASDSRLHGHDELTETQAQLPETGFQNDSGSGSHIEKASNERILDSSLTEGSTRNENSGYGQLLQFGVGQNFSMADVEYIEEQNDFQSKGDSLAVSEPNNLNIAVRVQQTIGDDQPTTVDNDTYSDDSHGSSSNPFADPPSLPDVADDLSELSDLELNFDGPIEWPDGEMMATQSGLDDNTMITGAPLLENAAAKLLLYQGDNTDVKSVDPRTQARLEALLEAAGIGKLSTTDGKAFADPEVLRKLTSSVSCALDEAAAALTRMRAETQSSDIESSNTKSLVAACSLGDIDAVKRLLSEGRSVHETNEDGESLLSLACSSGYYELADVLLRMRANVEDRGIKGDCTPLMEAASGGYVDVAQLLIAYDADVNAQSSAGHTALHHAAVGGYEDVVQLLIASGANVEEQNENGHTPLMESASAGHVGVAKILLNAGAGINTHSNEFKESALTLACYKGHLDMVKFLLDAGADQEHKTDEMHTALMEASMDGHVEVARLLLDSGAQVNMPADSFESPLTLAACGGHVDLAGLLIERGANLEEVNDEGYTPLMEASREGHEEMVTLLLSNEADVNCQTEETQETALTLACCGGFLEVAHYLIKAGADIELGCSTPLMEASQEGHLELAKYLIQQGSDVHALTGTSDTALTYACENGHTDVADVLLQAGAKLEHESEGGRTPLMKAARAGHLCTVQFLISKSANVNRSTTNNEHTVLSLACAGGHLGVVELLLEHDADPMHKLKDGSTMLIEAAKGGHTTVVTLLLDYPNGLHKTIAATANVSCEYPDSIPMADDLPADLSSAKDLSLKTTESLASRLEQFIHKMMSQAENSSGTREEQMARKQEILEELQRVEQELKFRTQMAQRENSGQHSPVLPPSLSDSGDQLSAKPLPPPPIPNYPPILGSVPPVLPNITPSHEYVEQELQQKQVAIEEQQRHEVQLQKQKEYYQAKLQNLKQQYQQKQLQLQQQRQQLLSQAANNSAGSTLESPEVATAETADSAEVAVCSKRQPIPLHIALQNHLHAHHVTEGNVNDLAQALQEWDTRDRSINLPQSQTVKPMPAFNLNAKPEDAALAVTDVESPVPDLPLRMEDLTFAETPPSRSLADSLATLIQGMDYKPSNFDPTLERAIEKTSSLKRPPSEYEMTFKTLEWLKKVDAGFCGDGSEEEQEPFNRANQHHSGLMPVPASKTTKEAASADKQCNTTKITKVLNGYVDTVLPPASGIDSALEPSLIQNAAGRPTTVMPSPKRSVSPPRLPFVDPNAETDSNHDTALTLACAGGHSELVKLLLNRNAEIEHRDKKGFTPLILASTAGHSEVVEILIDSGADIEAQSERTKDTPLSLACSGGRYEVVEILLRLGANKEHRNVSDYTPLSLAASGGYVNIIKLLLSYGAEINSRTGSKLGISPLMLAAMNGHTAAVKLLLDMGSDINAQIETNRNTALTLACFQGRHDVVSLLVDRKANIEHRAKTGLTPLMEAASGGYVEVGRVLLDKAADVNAPPVPSSKDTALTIAADKGHYRFVELLLSRSAAVDVKNKKGNSPLWLACNGGHLDVVQLLVSNNADIDSQDNRRVSSLMAAFRKGHIKVVKWLVRHVSQFPSDQECARYIATVNDKELLKKCQQCMSIIVQAKEQQAREALKNASILLEQIESEKSREERRKEAAARKREKKKQKRKERQAEQQTGKVSPEPESERSPTPDTNRSSTSSPASSSSQAMIVEPAGADTAFICETKSGINLTTSRDRKQPDGCKVSQNNKSKNEERPDVTGKENNVTSKRNRRNKDKGGSGRGRKGHGGSNSTESGKEGTTTRITELDDFGELPPLTPSGRSAGRHSGTKRDRGSSNINQLDCFDNGSSYNAGGKFSYSSSKSTPTKSVISPSPGKKKREEGGSDWKQVTNRKTKRVCVPSKFVSQLSKSIHALRDKSGAHIEFEAAEKKSGDRTIIIKGSADAIRSAHGLVLMMIKESDNGIDGQLSKKTLPVAGGVNATASTAQSGSQANNRSSSTVAGDSMASIGMFNLADYMPSAVNQAVPSNEAKVKVAQSKPSGWAVRPSLSTGQSAWGNPTSAALPATTVMSPRSSKALRPQVSSSAKQPSEVSRQLFPADVRTSISPMSMALNPKRVADTPRSQKSAENSQLIVEPPAKNPSTLYAKQQLPGKSPHVGASGAMPDYRHSAPLAARPTHTVGRPSVATSAMSAQMPGSAVYSPFDSLQQQESLLPSHKAAGYPSMSLDHWTQERAEDPRRSQVPPNRAPGFRPAVSPQLNQYLSAPPPQHPMVATDESFSNRASGHRGPLAGISAASGPEQLMSPLTAVSISSNVHTLFAESNQSSIPASAHSQFIDSQTKGFNLPPSSLLMLRDQYTTIDQPMTLPHISSLNPNADEFTTLRFNGERPGSAGVAQHSPRTNALMQQRRASPIDLRSVSAASLGYQPQSRVNPAVSMRQQPSSDMEMFRQMMQSSSTSSQVPATTTSLHHKPTTVTAPLPQQQGLSIQHGSFSPSHGGKQLITPPTTDGALVGESPPAAGLDGVDRTGGVRPIGGERHHKTPSSMFHGPVADIWGNSKTSNGEWAVNMNVVNAMNDPPSVPPSSIQPDASSYIKSMFPPMDGSGPGPIGGLPAMSHYQFYSAGSLPAGGGGTGDGLQNTWNNSPSKLANTKEWPSWDQTTNQQ